MAPYANMASEVAIENARQRGLRYNKTDKAKARSKRYNDRHRESRREAWRKANLNRREQRNEWARANRDKRRATEQRYRERYPDKYKEICRNSNRQKRELAKVDPIARLERKLRNDLRKRLKCGKHGHRSWDLVGCTVAELKRHIESQFEPGMTWENWGYRGWHIDHRTPLASFDLSKSEQVKAAFHFTNLQPLWAGQNLSKGAKLNFAVN